MGIPSLPAVVQITAAGIAIENPVERLQYQTPGKPVIIAGSEIKRPIPENNAIATS